MILSKRKLRQIEIKKAIDSGQYSYHWVNAPVRASRIPHYLSSGGIVASTTAQAKALPDTRLLSQARKAMYQMGYNKTDFKAVEQAQQYSGYDIPQSRVSNDNNVQRYNQFKARWGKNRAKIIKDGTVTRA